MMKKWLRAVAVGCCLLMVYSCVARERITDFHSDIVINKDTSMKVRETIVIKAEGDQIVHGLVREFPTKYRDYLGTKYVVDFTLNEVLLDGQQVPFKVKSAINGKKIYIGDADFFLRPGIYTYTIAYTTNRQLGFFAKYDELYWNVTGTGWRLPIDKATAHVTLPKGIPVKAVTAEGYTGPQGAKGRHYNAVVNTDGTVSFSTTKPLGVREGLTIVATWPKGFVSAPNWWDHVYYFFHDNLVVLWLLLGLFLLLFYYGFVWRVSRRTQLPGTVIPLFHPPDNLSPAEVGFMTNMGYNQKQFAAEIVQLAVKGVVTIFYAKKLLHSGEYSLTYKQGMQEKMISSYGVRIIKKLFVRVGDGFEISVKNQPLLSLAIGSVKNKLKIRFDRYLDDKFRYVFGGIIASSLFFIPVFIFWSEYAETSWFFMLLIVYVLINILSAYQIKTYSQKGRNLQDKIDGFKLFLETTEIERMKVIGTPPIKTPELYEEYLPYAMALGIEDQWSKQFAPVFAELEQKGQPYAPIWYVGPGRFHGRSLSVFSSNLSSAMSSAIASASTPPGRGSGSGGGGSSGGGGGGGGGGGW